MSLIAAIRQNLCLEVIKSFKEVDVANRYGTTALMWAFKCKYASAAIYLLNAGASIQCMNMEKKTAVDYLARWSRQEIREFILDIDNRKILAQLAEAFLQTKESDYIMSCIRYKLLDITSANKENTRLKKI